MVAERTQKVVEDHQPASSPLMYPKHAKRVSFGPGRVFIVMLHGAYNARGLIGSECNGLGILDDTKKQVLLAEHMNAPTGWYTGFGGPTNEQIAELERVVAMEWDEFVEFVNTNRKARYKINTSPIKPKVTPLTKAERQWLVHTVMNESIDAYSEAGEERKLKFLTYCVRMCNHIAKQCGYTPVVLKRGEHMDPKPGHAVIHVNPSGIACSGDVYLEADRLYICFSQGACCRDLGFMYRHGKDAGNMWMRWNTLLDMNGVIETFQRIVGKEA
jgi:hypothetical protein